MAEIDALKLDARNANQGTKRGKEILSLSVDEGGAGRSILVDADLNVLAGNQTVKVWKENGTGRIRIVETQGDELVVVKRTDISLDDPDTADKARRLALADNRSSEAGLSWHLEILQGDAALGLLDGLWTPDEMDELFASVVQPDEEPSPIADGVAPFANEAPQEASDTILSFGEYRTFVKRDDYLEWLEQIREAVGFDKEAILAEMRRRMGLHAD
jgi:hypothetical protein